MRIKVLFLALCVGIGMLFTGSAASAAPVSAPVAASNGWAAMQAASVHCYPAHSRSWGWGQVCAHVQGDGGIGSGSFSIVWTRDTKHDGHCVVPMMQRNPGSAVQEGPWNCPDNVTQGWRINELIANAWVERTGIWDSFQIW